MHHIDKTSDISNDFIGFVKYFIAVKKIGGVYLNDNKFIHCDFIWCSVAEVERLWFIITYVLANNRKKTELHTLEMLIFSKIRVRLWINNNLMITNTIRSAYFEEIEAQGNVTSLPLSLFDWSIILTVEDILSYRRSCLLSHTKIRFT